MILYVEGVNLSLTVQSARAALMDTTSTEQHALNVLQPVRDALALTNALNVKQGIIYTQITVVPLVKLRKDGE